jgi:hypothetical protein
MTIQLTIFTSPKPFTNPHIAVIQRNAIRSWLELGDEVQVILFGEEEGLAEVARELNVTHIPNVKRNSAGTPLLSDMFKTAQEISSAPIFAFVNADILLMRDFLETALKVHDLCGKYLMVGQRWDLDITSPIDFSNGWQQQVGEHCSRQGKLHKPTGSDYFIFPRGCFSTIPDFAIGRAGWDNWMLYEARQRGWKLIDATESIHIIHQNHDYSHLPGGQSHYHLPESHENTRQAGGKRYIFLLQDINWKVVDGKLKRPQMTWQRFWREVEIFPLVILHSEALGKLFFAIFHPRKAYNEFRKAQIEKGTQE